MGCKTGCRSILNRSILDMPSRYMCLPCCFCCCISSILESEQTVATFSTSHSTLLFPFLSLNGIANTLNCAQSLFSQQWRRLLCSRLMRFIKVNGLRLPSQIGTALNAKRSFTQWTIVCIDSLTTTRMQSVQFFERRSTWSWAEEVL